MQIRLFAYRSIVTTALRISNENKYHIFWGESRGFEDLLKELKNHYEGFLVV
jgi:hypothetical protein